VVMNDEALQEIYIDAKEGQSVGWLRRIDTNEIVGFVLLFPGKREEC